jgi:hypothetical protein
MSRALNVDLGEDGRGSYRLVTGPDPKITPFLNTVNTLLLDI